jgi:hypothetical protein
VESFNAEVVRRSYAPHFVSLSSRLLVAELELCFVFGISMRIDSFLDVNVESLMWSDVDVTVCGYGFVD